MKWHSPFILCWLCALLFSCGNGKEETVPDPNNPVDLWIQQSQDVKADFPQRLQALRNAYKYMEQHRDSLGIIKNAGQLYYLERNVSPDSNAYHIKQLERTALRSGDRPLLAYYYNSRGEYERDNRNYPDAFLYYNKAKLTYKELADSTAAGYSSMRLAHLQLSYNDYYAAEKSATEAMALLKSGNNSTYLTEVYNILGLCYTGTQQFPLAIDNYRNAQRLSATTADREVIDNNIGYIHILQKDYDKAIALFARLSKSPTVTRDTLALSRTFDNLGYSLLKNDDKVAALPFLMKALQLREHHRYTAALPSSYIHLSEYYAPLQPDLAVSYAEKAYVTSTVSNSIDDRIEALALLSRISKGPKLITYLQKRAALTDSIVTVRRQAENKFAKLQYDFSDKAKQVEKYKRETEIQELKTQNTTIVFTASIVLIVLIVVFLYFIYRAKHRREKQLEAYHTETRISKKIHDELANDVYYTMTFAEQQNLADVENRETLLNNLDNIYSRTRDISYENNSITTGEGFAQDLKALLSRYNSQQVWVILAGFDSVPWHTLKPELQILLYRIIQELLTNMKKHSNCSRAVFSFRFEKKKVTIEYSDDGVGVQSEQTFFKKNLPIMENRIRGINGRLTFENTSGKGFRLAFTFPLKQ